MAAWLMVIVVRLFATLQWVLELKSRTLVINSYRGVSSIGESRALLEGNSNICSRSGANKGERDDATERSELHKRLS
jgi:hypothetical protein